jgi:hypothetical protein
MGKTGWFTSQFASHAIFASPLPGVNQGANMIERSFYLLFAVEIYNLCSL